MPALRKSARSSAPRSSTTPFASPTATPSDHARDTSQPSHQSHQSLQSHQQATAAWAEPAVQHLAPSFEEHGFARHGVLENMAPLGVPPSAKVKQRTRAMGDTAARKSLHARSSLPFGDEQVSTPEVTPAPDADVDVDADDDQEPNDADDLPLPLNLPLPPDDADDDYVPAKSKKKASSSKTPVRGKTPVKNGASVLSSTPASPAVQPPRQSSSSSSSSSEIAQRMKIAVLDAVTTANRNDRRHIGTALMQMFDLSQHDADLAATMNAIIHQNQTAEQWDAFRSTIKGLRKKLRNEAKQQRLRERRQSVDANGSSNSCSRSSPRASSEIAPDDSASAANDDEERAPSNTNLTDSEMADVYPSVRTQDTLESVPHPHPLSTAPAFAAKGTSAGSTSRMSSKSPRKKAATNGHLAPSIESGADGRTSVSATTPAINTPEDGTASDSELSDVNEEIVQKGPPEPIISDRPSAAASATAAKKAKSATLAMARAAKKPKAGKPFGKHAYKQHPPTAEQIADDEQAFEARREMVEAQPVKHFEMPFPTSDVRFDDEILETESLTDSQIAVGPPVDSDQPRRAGRVPQHGAKRLRDDASRYSSPLLESAAATRPSTPPVAPAVKRLKLNNGQAARTKRSPVKNRDGGPIAGVAFNGGGGSRQLGPDVNDPNSPQSESDDLCSACRGAGEFVCCEGCPRVFHLLCCDPPRLQVPEGSFYCYECTARLGLSEDVAAESYPSLGPLFKSLERTNQRAFALPSDVQNQFEDVTARGDGSYFEEMKKFPLSKNSGYGYQKPDYTRVLDADQKPILCVQCGVSSGNKRQMLKCDFCTAYWHLDCLDPPLANPPHISLEASQRDAWRCPRHVEHDLRSGLLVQKDLNELAEDAEMADAESVTRVARKIRKRKHPDIVEPTFSRGMPNNGLIEIINDPDDDTDGEGNYTGLEVKDLNSKVFRVPERGLILDFLSKVKNNRAIDVAKAAPPPRNATMHNFVSHSLQQQQAALNLTKLANQESAGFGESTIEALILRLTAEAPQDVTTAMANEAPPPLKDDERAMLLKLQQLIQRRLDA